MFARLMQDLRCSDDESSTEDSTLSHPVVTSSGDVFTHVIDDAGESQSAVDSRSDESQRQETMTSMTSRHMTLNSNLKSPISSQADTATTLRQTPSTSRASESYLRNIRTQNLDGVAIDRVGKVDSSVQDLEKMLSQVEASERQAWSWLEALDVENTEQVGDLRQYITSLEQHKRQTSEAIAELLQIECSLRQQLNRKRSAATSALLLPNNDPNDLMLDDVSRSLNRIVGRLQVQRGAAALTGNDSAAAAGHEYCGLMMSSPSSGYRSTTSEPTAAAAGGLYRNVVGGSRGGVDSDEGYDGNSNSLQSADSVHRYRSGEAKTTHVTELETEVARLRRLLDAYRWSQGGARSPDGRTTGQSGAGPLGYLDSHLLQAQSDIRRLQGRVNDVETEKLELERELNKTTSKLRGELEKVQTELQLQKNDSNHKAAELQMIETSLKRTVKEVTEQLDFEKDKRQCLEKELLDAVEAREEFRRLLHDTNHSLSSLQEKLDVAEQSNKQLMAQANFLTKTNESLMEDIDDVNERMSDELAKCRQGRSAAELRCQEVESQCERLTETVQVVAERARTLEKSLEEAERSAVECERLRHQQSVLVASEEKLVDKINDKDDALRKLMDELSECRRSLEEQNHKLQMTSTALESHKDDNSRYQRELEDSRIREQRLHESEKQLMLRVSELEMAEAVLTTKLSAMDTDKEHLCRIQADLRHELDDSRRAEKDLIDKVANLEKSELQLQENVQRLESRATHLVELLRNTQEMSLHQQLRSVIDVSCDDDDDADDDVIDDDADEVHRASSTAHCTPDPSTQQASSYDLERSTKVELLTKVYQLERKCFLQRNKIRDMTSEMSTFRQTVAEANHRQLDSVLPALMSTVEHKVLMTLCSRIE